MECESLAMWIDEDGQSPDIIKAALSESVISDKLNFRYIDRILFDWKKNGIETLEQAKIHGTSDFVKIQERLKSQHNLQKQSHFIIGLKNNFSRKICR